MFIGATSLIFFLGGFMIEATDHLAHRLHRNGFLVAFILLGTLTSFSEMSVAFNATLERVPQISVGNLVGGSFVIFLLIIPFLAFFGKGIKLERSFTNRHVLLALAVIGAPAIFILDGILTRTEGLIMFSMYGFFVVYANKGQSRVKSRSLPPSRSALYMALSKIVVSGIIIFLSGKILVDEALYFSNLLAIPASIIGLLIIAIGTNVPEIVIAIRAIKQKRKTIAFGDFVGSASFNTLLLGALILINGTIYLEPSEFIIASVFLTVGLLLFYIFSRSKTDISRTEGACLGLVYGFFVLMQIVNALFVALRLTFFG